MAALGETETAPPYRLRECNRHTIDSALAAPRWAFAELDPYPTLPAKAAVLLYSLARSQACPDGNKRIALILLVEFLFMNGQAVGGDPAEPAERILWAAQTEASDRETVMQQLTNWFEQALEPLT